MGARTMDAKHLHRSQEISSFGIDRTGQPPLISTGSTGSVSYLKPVFFAQLAHSVAVDEVDCDWFVPGNLFGGGRREKRRSVGAEALRCHLSHTGVCRCFELRCNSANPPEVVGAGRHINVSFGDTLEPGPNETDAKDGDRSFQNVSCRRMSLPSSGRYS